MKKTRLLTIATALVPVCWILLLHGVWEEAGWRTATITFIIIFTQVTVLIILKKLINLASTLATQISIIREQTQYNTDAVGKILGTVTDADNQEQK